jgi:membrane protease YdiL (CAAX protease family)
MLYGAAAGILYLALVYLAWLATDNVRFAVRHTSRQLAMRLLGAPFTALFIALAEELLFRGVLLAGLLETLRPPVAVPIGVAAFASAHYIRRVKRYWTFPGHLALGTLLCLAFLWTRALWLPLGLHAGGVLVLMGVRPLVRYRGPAWLVGASIFPYAGAVGIVALLLLTSNIWLTFGGAA